jgi:hypothetical protein
MFPALRRCLGRAEIAAIQKTTGKNKEIIRINNHTACNDIRKMRYIGTVSAGYTRGVRAFDFAVGAVPGDHERTYSNRHGISCVSPV